GEDQEARRQPPLREELRPRPHHAAHPGPQDASLVRADLRAAPREPGGVRSGQGAARRDRPGGRLRRAGGRLRVKRGAGAPSKPSTDPSRRRCLMSRSLRRILLACTLLALAGCIVAEPPPVVQQPPPSPPARVEVAPAPPGPGYVWVPGHWAWRGPAPGPSARRVGGHGGQELRAADRLEVAPAAEPEILRPLEVLDRRHVALGLPEPGLHAADRQAQALADLPEPRRIPRVRGDLT